MKPVSISVSGASGGVAMPATSRVTTRLGKTAPLIRSGRSTAGPELRIQAGGDVLNR